MTHVAGSGGKNMARPIEATPVLKGRDAERFLDSVRPEPISEDRQRWMQELMEQSRKAERKAIVVHVERDEGGSFVVSEANTGAFHYDNDLSRAVAGFVGAFVDEFEFLVHNEGSLSPALISDLERFRILVERSAE